MQLGVSLRSLAHGFLACSMLAAAGVAQQNVCVIVLDDCGPELLGAYDLYFASIGKPSGWPANTPAIDGMLAARGLMFTRAWAAPVCTPTRAQMLTGRYASRCGVGSTLVPRDLWHEPGLDPATVTLPELLGEAPVPYHRAALGKWHLASHDQIAAWPLHPLGEPAGRWFEHFAGPLYNLQKPEGLPASASSYTNWIKHFATLDGNVLGLGSEGLATGSIDVLEGSPSSYAIVDTANDALKMINTLREPWFMWVSFNSVHVPAHVVPPGLPDAECAGYEPPLVPCVAAPSASKAEKVRCMLEALDGQVARVVCALDESDTTVVLVGDNGTSKYALVPPYPSSHGKATVYESGVHVPMIVRSPLIPPGTAGTTCDALVNTLDVFATVCDLAQVDPAASTGSDSISLLPYLLGSTLPLRATNYAEMFNPNFTPDANGAPPPGYSGIRHDQALRDERFKLIRRTRRTHGGIVVAEELYDLAQGGPPDPGTTPPSPTADFFEQNDLLDAAAPPLSPEAAAALTRLRAELDALHPTLVL
ncbi:MAG: sulfatase-like hydrolase/transferase [Planctomycetes bacterium]|nr:sulfatase-like hydrolase/transferase [Planctomycetota bacterium]